MHVIFLSFPGNRPPGGLLVSGGSVFAATFYNRKNPETLQKLGRIELGTGDLHPTSQVAER
jgi:hypothetical protein